MLKFPLLSILGFVLIAPSCVSLSSPERQLEAVFGIQDGSHGDVAGTARPVVGVNLLGKRCKNGLQGVLGLHVSSGDFGGLNDEIVTTDAVSLGALAGLRWIPSVEEEGAASPFIGGGLSFESLDIELTPGSESEKSSGVGPYLEVGVRMGSLSVSCRRLLGMEMSFDSVGDVDVVLDQFLVGWTLGF
jgi:hypothetical protein